MFRTGRKALQVKNYLDKSRVYSPALIGNGLLRRHVATDTPAVCRLGIPGRQSLLRQRHVRAVSSMDESRRSLSMMNRVWDVVRSGSFHPPNPVLEGVVQGAELADDKPNLPDFSKIMPHHLVKAGEQVQNENRTILAQLEQDLESDMDSFVKDPERLLNELDRLEATSFYVSNVATLYLTLQQTPAWQKACSSVHGMLSEQPFLESVPIRNALQRIQGENVNSLPDSSRWLVQYYLSKVTLHFINDEEKHASVVQLDAALRRLESEVISQTSKPTDPTQPKQSSPSKTKAQLELIHTYIAVQHQRATTMGHGHHAESVFSSQQSGRLAVSTSDVASLHQEIAARATPVIQSTPVKEWQEATEGDMVDTSDYLTLDGVLGGIVGLSRALFGIKIQEEQEFIQGWQNDVRLFHIYSEDDKYMASFYLDPYSNPIKMLRPFMNPLQGNRSAFMSCRIRAPMWDHLPTPLRIEDAANLLHEFGHILQFLLAGSDRTALGAQNLPLDVSEIMPQFMEHWLFEESVLQSFAHLSQSTIPDELIEKLKQQRSLRKASDLLRHAFLSQLELDMFSTAKQEDESLVAFQRRVALDFVPHELPARSDLTPMMEIVENNAKGKQIAQYRYLYGEVLSAQLFAKFQEAGIKDQTKVQELGAKLRTCFLQPGASLDAKMAFESLLSSSHVSPEAMFKLYNFD